MRKRPNRPSRGFFARALDTATSFLIKAMIASFVIGAALVVASEFYEPALGKWSMAIATPYVLIIPVYAMKLTLHLYEKLTGSLIKSK